MSTTPQPRKRRSWGYHLLQLVIGLIVCYVVVVVGLLLLEDQILYHPSAGSEPWTKGPDPSVQDIELQTSDGTFIHARWLPAENAAGAILFCHGTGRNLSLRGDKAMLLRDQLQESVLIFDYPGFGESGGKPSETGCYAAADAAHDWLVETKKVPPERIVIVGKSLGGGVAVDLAARRDHRALVLLKTFTSIPDVAHSHFPWIPTRWLMHNRFDSLAKIGNCRRPVFIAHGTVDKVIPFAESEQLFAAANEPKQFFRMEGISHRDPDPMLTSEGFAALKRFLAEKASITEDSTTDYTKSTDKSGQ